MSPADILKQPFGGAFRLWSVIEEFDCPVTGERKVWLKSLTRNPKTKEFYGDSCTLTSIAETWPRGYLPQGKLK